MEQKTSEELYNELINSDNEEITIQWKKALEEKRKFNLISLSICAILDILILYMISKNIGMLFSISNFFKIYLIVPILIIDAIVYVVMVTVFGKEQRKYNNVFKENIIKKILCNFYDNLEYFPIKQISQRIYDEPQYESYDNYYSDDYMEAVLDNRYSIQMAEVETEVEETYKDSEGKEHTTTRIIFHGLFAKIDMEKSINCSLDIKLNNNLNFEILKRNKLEMDSRRI